MRLQLNSGVRAQQLSMPPQSLAITFAKLAAHFKTLNRLTSRLTAQYFDPAIVSPVLESVDGLVHELKLQLPELYGDLVERAPPRASGTTDFEGRGYVERGLLEERIRDLDYIFEVRSGSQTNVSELPTLPQRVFISHGRAADWREVQPFIERDVGLETLELAQQPNRGRTVLQKLSEEAGRSSFAVIVMTGDDSVGDEAPRARENVIHEIGYFQGRYGLHRVALLYEEGTNIPSNIHGLVYIPFPSGLISAAFSTLQRELNDAFSLRS